MFEYGKKLRVPTARQRSKLPPTKPLTQLETITGDHSKESGIQSIQSGSQSVQSREWRIESDELAIGETAVDSQTCVTLEPADDRPFEVASPPNSRGRPKRTAKAKKAARKKAVENAKDDSEMYRSNLSRPKRTAKAKKAARKKAVETAKDDSEMYRSNLSLSSVQTALSIEPTYDSAAELLSRFKMFEYGKKLTVPTARQRSKLPPTKPLTQLETITGDHSKESGIQSIQSGSQSVQSRESRIESDELAIGETAVDSQTCVTLEPADDRPFEVASPPNSRGRPKRTAKAKKAARKKAVETAKDDSEMYRSNLSDHSKESGIQSIQSGSQSVQSRESRIESDELAIGETAVDSQTCVTLEPADDRPFEVASPPNSRGRPKRTAKAKKAARKKAVETAKDDSEMYRSNLSDHSQESGIQSIQSGSQSVQSRESRIESDELAIGETAVDSQTCVTLEPADDRPFEVASPPNSRGRPKRTAKAKKAARKKAVETAKDDFEMYRSNLSRPKRTAKAKKAARKKAVETAKDDFEMYRSNLSLSSSGSQSVQSREWRIESDELAIGETAVDSQTCVTLEPADDRPFEVASPPNSRGRPKRTAKAKQAARKKAVETAKDDSEMYRSNLSLSSVQTALSIEPTYDSAAELLSRFKMFEYGKKLRVPTARQRSKLPPTKPLTQLETITGDHSKESGIQSIQSGSQSVQSREWRIESDELAIGETAVDSQTCVTLEPADDRPFEVASPPNSRGRPKRTAKAKKAARKKAVETAKDDSEMYRSNLNVIGYGAYATETLAIMKKWYRAMKSIK
ncbi:hypothetical protein PInf_013643 [Phytophthora infestans]|nr:hypothetical protein PInf_013643 [Phytophthora infestans]